MWREAVIKLCAVALGTLLLASGGVGASCQSDGSRADGSRLDDQKNKGREADLPSSEAGTTDQQKQDAPDANDRPQEQEKPSKGKTRFRFGTVTVGTGYTHFPAGVFASPFWGYGFSPYAFAYEPFYYNPFFYEPFYYPSFYVPSLPDLAYRADKGEVRLEAKPNSASVYLDDAYAGTAGKLKHMWLAPGAYDLTVSAIDGSMFHQRIYVLSGRSLKIKAKFVARNE
jgi:hypothetical protein